MIDVTLPQGALGEGAKARLTETLTATLIELEGAPDNEYVRAITWCLLDERPAGAIAVGGVAATEPAYRVVLTVPEGAPGVHGPLMFANREALVHRVTEAVLEAEGTEMSTAAARRVWVQIRTIPDGHWGGYGELVTITDIADYSLGSGEEGSKGQRARAALEAGRAAV